MNEQMNTPQEEFPKALLIRDVELEQEIEKILGVHLQKAPENLEWLYANLHPYFFITMKGEVAAIVNLAAGLHEVAAAVRGLDEMSPSAPVKDAAWSTASPSRVREVATESVSSTWNWR